MKRVLIICLAVLVTAVMANAQSVVGSKHDLSTTGGTPATDVTRVCVFCHTPHQASAANGQYPLWNHTLSSTASYGTYSSPTLDATDVTDLGGATVGTAPTSNLCLSCHDGTVSVASMYNPPNENPSPTITAISGRIDSGGLIISTANLGTDLTDDHPVNFTYDTALATADGALNDPATDSAVAALLINSKVQCTSCHEVHDPTNVPFLVMDNTGSALCITCHIK